MKEKIEKYEKQLTFLYDLCNRNMEVFDAIEEKYSFWDKEEPGVEGHGFKFYGNEDNFLPIFDISLSVDDNKPCVSVVVENRNGNDILYGNDIALYKMEIDFKDNMKDKEIKKIDERYKNMMKCAIDKWSIYNKENILGYIEDEETEEF